MSTRMAPMGPGATTVGTPIPGWSRGSPIVSGLQIQGQRELRETTTKPGFMDGRQINGHYFRVVGTNGPTPHGVLSSSQGAALRNDEEAPAGGALGLT